MITLSDGCRFGEAVLLQCARGEHVGLLELTRPIPSAYAAAHSMDYVCRFDYQPSDRHAGWNKIALILELLRTRPHRFLCWLDADTQIVDPERDLRDALPRGCWLGMVQHGDPPYFNDGAMYVRRCERALAFFEEVWACWPVDNPWEDNAAVIDVLARNPERWRGVAIAGDEWNSTENTNDCPAPVVRAWHGQGSTGSRVAALRETLSALPPPPRGRAARSGHLSDITA